jgi:hypothetical protein
VLIAFPNGIGSWSKDDISIGGSIRKSYYKFLDGRSNNSTPLDIHTRMQTGKNIHNLSSYTGKKIGTFQPRSLRCTVLI